MKHRVQWLALTVLGFAPGAHTIEFAEEDWADGLYRREDIRVELEERE